MKQLERLPGKPYRHYSRLVSDTFGVFERTGRSNQYRLLSIFDLILSGTSALLAASTPPLYADCQSGQDTPVFIPINLNSDTRSAINMPALPAISTGSGTQAYAPLSDESYSPSLTITRTMPDARMSRLSSTSSLSSENGYLSTERVRSGSDDTLSASNNGKGKAINRLSGDSDFMSQRTPNIQVVRDEDEGDVGDYREKQRERERKGKMRADYGERQRPWDEEKGRVEDIYGGQGAYPPTNEEEEEEKRIQEVSRINLTSNSA